MQLGNQGDNCIAHQEKKWYYELLYIHHSHSHHTPLIVVLAWPEESRYHSNSDY